MMGSNPQLRQEKVKHIFSPFWLVALECMNIRRMDVNTKPINKLNTGTSLQIDQCIESIDQ